MKYATIVFMRVLNGLFSCGAILPDRRITLAKAWKKATDSEDVREARNLLNELRETTESRLWKEELAAAIASL